MAPPAALPAPGPATPAPAPVAVPAPVARTAHWAGSRRQPAAERYRGRLLRYANRLTPGDPHQAEDIVQETMLRAWLATAEFAGEEGGFHADDDHLVAWLHTVARNLAVDARRRDRSVPLGIVPAALLHLATDDGGDVADAVVNRVAVVGALSRLSPLHRDVLAHVHLGDRSRADAARLLGIPKGTVKSRVHYALAALRSEFEAAHAAEAA